MATNPAGLTDEQPGKIESLLFLRPRSDPTLSPSE